MIETANDSSRALQRFIERATEQAAGAIRAWTHGSVELAMEEVAEAPIGETTAQLGVGEQLRTMVVLGIEGPAGGRLILSFDEANGKRLVDAVFGGQRTPAGKWSDLERSTIMETGNIFASAYLSGLTKLTGKSFIPTPPFFIQDYGACVLEEALMPQMMERDESLLVRVRFRFNAQHADWDVFFVPETELIQQIETSQAFGGRE
jgi:chemotaxis protein CheC